MEKSHKRALIVIFSFLFTCLIVATIFITAQAQSLGLSGILITVACILAIDIGWVMNSDTAAEPQ